MSGLIQTEIATTHLSSLATDQNSGLKTQKSEFFDTRFDTHCYQPKPQNWQGNEQKLNTGFIYVFFQILFRDFH